MLELHELKPGLRVKGLVAAGEVTIVALEDHGDEIVNIVYKDDENRLADRLLTREQAKKVEIVEGKRWAFNADGAHFKLASEARRIQLAYLFDPFAAIGSSSIEPLPHQIEAVYDRLLPLQPLRFLLADDPGAGKTIMSGLYIRELMLRGDLDRCLIIAPGSLVEQWQEELHDKFELSFDILSRDMVEASRTGNPFQEKNLLIARLDQLSRSEDLQAKLDITEWDLIVIDEAHKMSAHLYGDEVKRTLRFRLGELVRERTRNLLLLTATPHNGSDDDFLLFMSLLDPDRYGGRLRNTSKLPDVSDSMRRLVKENLLTFAGKRLFTERLATTVNYDLSPAEEHLYEAVTAYVRNGMGRAETMENSGDRRRGLAIGFALTGLQRRLASSPLAILRSLERRTERLQKKLIDAQTVGEATADFIAGVDLPELDGFDYDEFDDAETEQLEDEVIENAMSADSIEELEREITELRLLVDLAKQVNESGQDRKWIELSNILQSDELSGKNSSRKLIIFTEHKDTLSYLESKIKTVLGNPKAVVTIHGGVAREERRRIQDAFRNDPTVKILVATDAAGEGVNLQRANLMVNYDLPWNPNRIEQRFGRIHRIGQDQICHLWNLVAHGTREGMVFQRLFEKIEQQRGLYGDQIYDVLGDSEINRSLQDLLIKAIRYGEDPKVVARCNEIIDAEIGNRLIAVLDERALATDALDLSRVHEIRHLMEKSFSRKLQPGFIQSFFSAALEDLGGRITKRESGRFEITRVPVRVRTKENQAKAGGRLNDKYERVTFDKNFVTNESTAADGKRAELLSLGHPLLNAIISTTLDCYGQLLTAGTTFIDPTDTSDIIRVLVYLEHSITDGHFDQGKQRTVSRRFQFVEINENGDPDDPGADPYLNYEPVKPELAELIQNIDTAWANAGVEKTARSWATEALAEPHFNDVVNMVTARLDRTRSAVEERLNTEIRYWDARAAELKQEELHGKNPRRNSGQARQRADEIEVRKANRLHELDIEADLVNHAPTIVAAALVIPQGLVDQLIGTTPTVPDQEIIKDTDRRAVAAVMAAERGLGRLPVEQDHNNPGFDILSEDPNTGMIYQIEVKGHRPDTLEVYVKARQVRQAKQNSERFRLAVVEVPNEPAGEPIVSYFLRPFDTYEMHFAQTFVPLRVSELLPHAVEPQ